ncbi:MAG: methanol dehydrogenase, partial [Acidobacteria bacterium]|nr:methanol dehydrogenase [Acidobacteriota bacterium]
MPHPSHVERCLRRKWWGLVVALVVALPGCKMPPAAKQAGGASSLQSAGAASLPAFTTTANEDGQWLSVQKDYANTRFSGLSQINLSNVDLLKAATTFSTGLVSGHEATPLVVGSTMYLVTPFPNILYALDLKEPGGVARWVYQPRPDPASQGVA